jgi:hypothetical protein
MSAIRPPAPLIAELLIEIAALCGDTRRLEMRSVPTNCTPLLLATMFGYEARTFVVRV